MLLTAFADRLRARGRAAGIVATVVAALVGVGGIFDQTSSADAPDYAAVEAAWKIDDDFAAGMQQRFPAGTKVLQLPYMSYPENGSVVGVGDYDLFKGYVHTKGLRWTYGAVRGRATDWMAQHPALAPEQLAAASATAGFGAVYLDRAGYADGGAGVATALGALAGPGTTAQSANGRLQFFDLRPAAARLAQRTTPAERAQVSDALVYPVALGFGDGFSYQENDAGIPYRWAGTDARLTLDNPLRGARTVRFHARLFGGAATPSAITFTLPDGTRRTLHVDDKGRTVGFPMRLEHGDSTLRLQTDGPAAPHPPNNVRDLRLRVVEQRIDYAPLEPRRLTRYVADATP